MGTGLNYGIERVVEFCVSRGSAECGWRMFECGPCGWMKFMELSGVLCGRKCSVKIKGMVYKVRVRAAMVYGVEAWVMRKEEEGVLQRAEGAMVMMMCGLSLGIGRVVWS